MCANSFEAIVQQQLVENIEVLDRQVGNARSPKTGKGATIGGVDPCSVLGRMLGGCFERGLGRRKYQ
jgi:hypothetical protein